MTGLPARVAAWERSGEYIELGRRRIFVRTTPGPADAPTLLFLHGFPSSSYDWRDVLGQLPGRRTIAFDFLGFGLSDKPRDATYSLFVQADLTEAVVARYADGPVTVVAHDMGTSVATELLARGLDDSLSFPLEKVLLLNGSVVIDKARLSRGQRLLRSPLGPLAAAASTPWTFRQEFRRLFSGDHPCSDGELADQWALLRRQGGNRLLHKLIRYVGERRVHAERWHGAIRDWPGELRLAWGLLDPVAVPDVLEALVALRPGADVTRWPGLGHYPQLEDAAAVAAAVAAL